MSSLAVFAGETASSMATDQRMAVCNDAARLVREDATGGRPMRYGFAGPNEIPKGGRSIIIRRLIELREVTEVTTGGAPGVDHLVAMVMLRLAPDAIHRLVIASDHSAIWAAGFEAKARLLESRSEVIRSELPRSRLGSVLLDHCDRLEAFSRQGRAITAVNGFRVAAGDDDSATIRLAAGHRIPTTITALTATGDRG